MKYTILLLLLLFSFGCDSTVGQRGEIDGDSMPGADEDSFDSSESADNDLEKEQSDRDDSGEVDQDRPQPPDGDTDDEREVLIEEETELEETSELEEEESVPLGYEDLIVGSGHIAREIPDPGTLTASISVVGDLPVFEIELRLIIIHDFMPDLSVRLESPSGHSYQILQNGDSFDGRRMDRSLVTDVFASDRTEGEWQLVIEDHKPGDSGALMFWSLAFIAQTGGDEDEEIPTEGFPMPIPDNDPAGVTDTIVVEEHGAVEGLCLLADIVHPHGGDLSVSLVGPQGMRVEIKQAGSPSIAYGGVITWKTEAFAEIDRYGAWMLHLSDVFGGDEGSLRGWELKPGCFEIGAVDGDEDEETDIEEADGDPDLDGENDSENETDDELSDIDDDDETDIEDDELLQEDDEQPIFVGSCEHPNSIAELPFSANGSTLDRVGELFPDPACCGWSQDGPETVWSLAMTAGQVVTISVAEADFDASVYVLSSCDSNSACRGQDRFGSAQDEMLVFEAEEDGEYYVVVDSANDSQSGEFSIFVVEGDLRNDGIFEASDGMPMEIPDNDPDGIESVIDIGAFVSVEAVCVELDLDHPSIQDLVVTIESPVGTSVVLHDHQQPAGSLSRTFVVEAFSGDWAYGEWILRVADTARYNIGTLKGWKLNLNCGAVDGDLDFEISETDHESSCPPDVFQNSNYMWETAASVGLPVHIENLTVCRNDNDWFRFALAAEQRVIITVNFIGSLGDIDIKLYISDRMSEWDYIDYSSGVGNTERIDYRATETNLYYLKVQVLFSDENSYSLDIEPY